MDDIHNNLAAYGIEGELAVFCIEFRAVVVQAQIATQLPVQILALAIALSCVLFSWLFGLLRKQCYCVFPPLLSGGALSA